jgi:Fic family protein
MTHDSPYNSLPLLPIDLSNLMTPKVYKKIITTNKELARLNGIEQMNNRKISDIFLHSLILTESIDSNIIENINTTIDSVAVSDAIKDMRWNEKETMRYKDAMIYGLHEMNKKENILSLNTIVWIQERIEENNAWIRKVPWTKLKNELTREIVYYPPDPNHLDSLLKNLETYINSPEMDEVDDCIKSAVIHYQFESIHPFLDWNGRTWRILILLYLIKQDLLDFPILYISWYINQNKAGYYRLLQEVRTKNNWEEYILYMLDAIEQQSKSTGDKIININTLYKSKLYALQNNSKLAWIEKLCDLLFQKIYISFWEILKNLKVSKPTLIKRLNELEEKWIIQKLKDWKNTLYFLEDYLKILKDK